MKKFIYKPHPPKKKIKKKITSILLLAIYLCISLLLFFNWFSFQNTVYLINFV